jgi:uncharacterized repeat protein (TIGR03803 family)
VLCPWQTNLLYQFGTNNNQVDGWLPSTAVVFDRAGNLYGTTQTGGTGAYGQGGVVYQLTRSGDTWNEDVLYNLDGGIDGKEPTSLIIDANGNLFGTTFYGGGNGCNGLGCGTIFQLSPSGLGWVETVIYSFQNDADGFGPLGGLVVDNLGNLYGTASFGGANDGGTVFELSHAGGAWTFNPLYSPAGTAFVYGPTGRLAMDAAGALYGAAAGNGQYGHGYVFKLSRHGSTWAFADLHNFTGLDDGSQPFGGIALDSTGNIFGATPFGGVYPCTQQSGGTGCGVVFEITQ